jgi:hypothetical protein
VARQPNYGQERAERQRRKAARRDERLAAKAERRDKSLASDSVPPAAADMHSPDSGLKLNAWTPDDASAMLRLGRALTFVCGAEHATTLAMQRAAISGDGDDIDRARTLFLQLTPSNRHAASTIAGGGAVSASLTRPKR